MCLGGASSGSLKWRFRHIKSDGRRVVSEYVESLDHATEYEQQQPPESADLLAALGSLLAFAIAMELINTLIALYFSCGGSGSVRPGRQPHDHWTAQVS